MEEIILPIHIIVLIFTAWNILRADHLGFSWVRGTKPILNANLVKKYHYRTLIGLILMIVTGFLLFWPLREYLLTRTQFYIKMSFVLALILNSFAIGKLSKIATIKTFVSLSMKEKIPLFISGAISTISWLGAFTMAFFLIPD